MKRPFLYLDTTHEKNQLARMNYDNGIEPGPAIGWDYRDVYFGAYLIARVKVWYDCHGQTVDVRHVLKRTMPEGYTIHVQARTFSLGCPRSN